MSSHAQPAQQRGSRDHCLYSWSAGRELTPEEYHRQFIKRFWAKVDKTPGQGPDGDCWTWTASCKAHGYGQIIFRRPDGSRTPLGAHVASHYLHTGKLPSKGMFICHRCDNPPCVNPAHLWEGTSADNIRDAQEKGRFRVAAPPTPKDTYVKIGKRLGAKLRAGRKAAKLSIYDVGELLGLDYTHIHYFEKGTRAMRYGHALTFLELAGNPFPASEFKPYQRGNPLKEFRPKPRPASAQKINWSETKSWARYADPSTEHYRADLIVSELKATGKRMNQMATELGIEYRIFQMVLRGQFIPVALLAKVCAYVGLPFGEVYELRAA